VLTRSADQTPEIKSNSVDLVVTSPPFLDVVDYATDNWLRCWFNGIEESKIGIWTFRKPAEWAGAMKRLFNELHRVVKPGVTSRLKSAKFVEASSKWKNW
jgi:DNA modification methylase